MQQIPISAIPNQEFQIILDNNAWAITLKTTEGCTTASFVLNNVTVIDSALAAAGQLIIPCIYQENGNFFFVTNNQDIPAYQKFGTTQFLIYASAADLDSVREKLSTNQITAADFNPIASLPLRFSPQGYMSPS